jgi:hypothetical protein
MGSIDLSGLHAYKRNAQAIAVKAVLDTTLVMEREAKRLAPIRKVYDERGGPSANEFYATRKTRQSFRTVSKTERGNPNTDVFSHGNFRRFQDVSALSARGRAELRRGIKSYEQGNETSVIEIDVRKRNVELFRPVGSVHRFDATKGVTRAKVGGKMVLRAMRRGQNKTYHLQLGGRLRRDIEARAPEVQGGQISGGVDSLAPYSVHVEFMTKRTRAQPFMRPAFKAHRNLLKANLKAGFREKEG